jgi:hypothetical protein
LRTKENKETYLADRSLSRLFGLCISYGDTGGVVEEGSNVFVGIGFVIGELRAFALANERQYVSKQKERTN